MITSALIPTNGVYITATQYPKGYQVASYDADGLCTRPQWFATRDRAEAYACAASTLAEMTKQLGR